MDNSEKKLGLTAEDVENNRDSAPGIIGYSFGGFMSSRNAMAHPDIFAGVGMGGMLFAGDVCAHELDGQFYPEYKLTDEMLARAESLGLPALIFVGENEMLDLVPLQKSPEYQAPDGVIPLRAEDKQAAFNRWRRAAGCGPVDFAHADGFYANHSDPVARSIGAEFERTEVREYNDRRYFIGDSVRSDGECLLRTVSCEGMAHWPSTVFAELVWEHIGRFARDVETGSSTYSRGSVEE